LKGAKGEY